MFFRRSIEILTFLLYWCVLIPFLYTYAKDNEYLKFDLNYFTRDLSKYILFLVVAILIYMVVYRISIWIYIKCKMADIKMYNSMRSLAMDIDDLERQANAIKQQQSKMKAKENQRNVKHYVKWMGDKITPKTKPKTIRPAPPTPTLTTTTKKIAKYRTATAPPPPPPPPAAAAKVQTISSFTAIPIIHKIPTMVTTSEVDGKSSTPTLKARIAALHSASAKSTPILHKKPMTNPGFVISNGDWV